MKFMTSRETQELKDPFLCSLMAMCTLRYIVNHTLSNESKFQNRIMNSVVPYIEKYDHTFMNLPRLFQFSLYPVGINKEMQNKI